MMRPVLILLGILFLAGFSFAATYEATRDAGCVASPDGSFGTIQEAVDAASDGDTVIVCNDGFYVENVVVDVEINLYGDSAETPVVTLSQSAPVINVSASNVNISNFTVSGPNDVTPYACGLYIRDAMNVTVEDFVATDSRFGVCVYDSVTSFITFNRLTSYDNGYANVLLSHIFQTRGPIAVYFNDSAIYESRYGIWLNRTDTVHVNNSAFYNINSFTPTTPGGSLDTGAILARSQVLNLIIHNNQFYDNYVSIGMGCDESELPCVKGGQEVLIGALISENEFGNHGLASILADVDGTADHLWMIRDNNFYGETPVHIYTDDLRNSTIMDNNFTSAGVVCIITEDSSWITYDSNRVEQCFMGMVMRDGNRNFNITNNFFNDSYFNFGFMALDPQDYYHNISTDNIIDTRPIYYFVEGSTGDGFTNYNPVPVQAGYVGVIATDNAVMHDMWDIGHNVNGVVVLNSSNVSIRSFRTIANFWGAYLGLFNSTVQDFSISDSHFRGISGLAAGYTEYLNCGLLTWGADTQYTNLLLNDHEICYYMALNFGPPTGTQDVINLTISYTHPTTERPLSGAINYQNFQFTGAGGVSYLIRDDFDFLTSLTRNLAIGPDFVSVDTDNPLTDPGFQNPANVTLLTAACPHTYYSAAGFPEDFDSVKAGGEFEPNVTMNCTGGLSTFEVAGFSGYAAEGPEGADDPDDSKSIELDYERMDCPENGVELRAQNGGILSMVEYRVLFNGLHYKTLLDRPGEYDLMLSAEGNYTVTAKKTGYDSDSVSFAFELCEEEEETHLSCLNNACVVVSGAGSDSCSSDSDCAPPIIYECTSDDDCADAYYCDIPLGQGGGSCKPVTGDCGYAANHKWVMYECGNETNCPLCPGDEICLNNTCVLRDIEGPDEGFVGDKAKVNATEDGGACAYCDVEIEFPDGKKVMGKTDANGQLDVPLDLKGQYAISLLGPDGYRLKTITVDSLPVEPAVDEPTPAVVQDEEFPMLWLILLLVAIVIIIAYSRRKKGKRK